MSDDMILIFLIMTIMAFNLLAAVLLLVQEHRRKYWNQTIHYEQGDYPYDWKLQEAVDILNETNKAA